MSGAAVISAVAGAVGAANAIHQGKKQQKAAKNARADAQAQAQKQERLADQAFNRENRKSPNVGTLLGNAQAASGRGAGSTLLTGPQGIDQDELRLGKKTLLGQ